MLFAQEIYCSACTVHVIHTKGQTTSFLLAAFGEILKKMVTSSKLDQIRSNRKYSVRCTNVPKIVSMQILCILGHKKNRWQKRLVSFTPAICMYKAVLRTQKLIERKLTCECTRQIYIILLSSVEKSVKFFFG